jgi:hypothetical protein
MMSRFNIAGKDRRADRTGAPTLGSMPQGDSASALTSASIGAYSCDHFVDRKQQTRRDRQAERLGGLHWPARHPDSERTWLSGFASAGCVA